MRTLGLTLTALLLAGPTAVAQTPGVPVRAAGDEPILPAAPVMTARNQAALDQFLKLWEDRMSAIVSLDVAKCAMTEISVDARGQQEQRVSTGDAQIMKPNFAKLMLKDPKDPGNAKRIKVIVADGKYYWDYSYAKKTVGVQQLPKDGLGGNTLMSFLFGMKAVQLKQRYHLAVDVDDPKRYNENYVHITILPKTKEDLQEFKKAELVLWKNNTDKKYADLWMLPARLWFQQTNQDQIVWQFEGVTTQRKLTAKHFEAPSVGEGWTREWITPPTPEVVRPVSGTGVPKK